MRSLPDVNDVNKRSSLAWSLIVLASLSMGLLSALVLSNGLDVSSVLLALRVSSLTTALPFLLIFSMRPLKRLKWTSEIGQWSQQYYRELWVITAVSHLIHLAQIGLYYTFGQSCPFLVWAVTIPLWLVVVSFAIIAIVRPTWFKNAQFQDVRLYKLGSWYVWLIFTIAFVLGAATQHLLFYNLPSAILFIASAILRLRPSGIVAAH